MGLWRRSGNTSGARCSSRSGDQGPSRNRGFVVLPHIARHTPPELRRRSSSRFGDHRESVANGRVRRFASPFRGGRESVAPLSLFGGSSRESHAVVPALARSNDLRSQHRRGKHRQVLSRCDHRGMPRGPQFQRFDLGQCKRGDVWRVVKLTAAANGFLVDSTNFRKFQQNRDFSHYGGGGLMTWTPHDFVIPRSGRWYIVAHAWGLRRGGRIELACVNVPTAMAPARQTRVDLASIAREAAAYGGTEDAPPIVPAEKEYDVFVCHASEDCEGMAWRSGSTSSNSASGPVSAATSIWAWQTADSAS